VVPAGSGRLSGLVATPSSLASAFALARPSRSAARMPSYFRAFRCYPLPAHSPDCSEEVLNLTVPTQAADPVASMRRDSSILLERCTPAFFFHGLPAVVACASAYARNLRSSASGGRHSHLHRQGRCASLAFTVVERHGPERPLSGCAGPLVHLTWRHFRVAPVALSPRRFQTRVSSSSPLSGGDPGALAAGHRSVGLQACAYLYRFDPSRRGR
jgi:hypothetical protein